MGRDKLYTNNNHIFKNVLSRTVGILLVVTVVIALSIGVVYARYVNLDKSNNSANVANVGVEIFNLVAYGKAIEGIDYSNIVPGVDIPGPHIQLKINSEVSYALFLQVTVCNCPTYVNVDGEKAEVVYFALTDDWELINTVTEENYTTFSYKYIVDTTDDVNNYVFKAGENHIYVDSNEIKILQDDVIYVSQNYSDIYGNGEDLSFFIKFESYIQQVL